MKNTVKSRKTPVIMLIVERSREFGRGLIRGIAKYSRLYGPWSIRMEPEFYIKGKAASNVSWVQEVKPDGVIMREQINTKSILEIGIPVIIANTVIENKYPSVPYIDADAHLIGIRGAEYFLTRGFKQFGFLGLQNTIWQNWSERRFEGFQYSIKKAGICDIHYMNLEVSQCESSLKEQDGQILKWLKSLPTPICVMACNDDYGRKLIDIAGEAGIRIPEEIAVLGVDNDEIICDLCSPSLSSIPLNTERAGFEAAELLAKMMAGKKPERKKISVLVAEVFERQSTDIMATEDSDIRNVICYIRQNFNSSISVDDIANATNVNRRTLERKFLRITGRGIAAEIKRVRISHIKKMLIETNLRISEIVPQLGFTTPDHAGRFFREETGLSLSEFRQNFK